MIIDIITPIRRRSLNWFEHLFRSGKRRFLSRSDKDSFSVKRPRERPPRRSENQIREHTGMSHPTLKRRATERKMAKLCA